MKVMTIAGTRPELIRLSRIIPALDAVCDHVFVWTGQNYDPKLSDVFFEELGIREPDRVMFTKDMAFHSSMDWVGSLIGAVKPILDQHKPDRLLILGDTNSAMSAYVAKRMGIPVFHMEAGNRCYDDRVPEEVNRRVIDACSDVLLPYTNRSRDNLLAEGYPARKIHVTGNPIWEVLNHYEGQINDADPDLGLVRGEYFLITAHRAETVDSRVNLKLLHSSILALRDEFPSVRIVVSVHPRTRSRLDAIFPDHPCVTPSRESQIQWLEPFGFFDFVKLQKHAAAVLSDSGTVQEEACLLGVPNVTLRNVTERPETIDCGSAILAGIEPANVVAATRIAMRSGTTWGIPEGYQDTQVSAKVVKILLGRLP